MMGAEMVPETLGFLPLNAADAPRGFYWVQPWKLQIVDFMEIKFIALNNTFTMIFHRITVVC
jgi:hypothetical protein